MTIEVIRARPPELGRCRHEQCRRPIEWVLTVAHQRRMPVDHPLLVDHVHDRADGVVITTIDSGASHFATCPAAKAFRRARGARHDDAR
jgi:hypothetical protein